MEHAAHLVDILNEKGAIVGQKLRREIDKETDIYHAVYIFMITPRGEVVLSVIPAREDLPNLYARQLGVPVATIRRHDEASDHAAERAISRELFIDHANLLLLGQTMLTPDGKKTYATCYCLVAEPPDMYSIIDVGGLVVVTTKELRNMLETKPEQFAPTFLELWKCYEGKLPV